MTDRMIQSGLYVAIDGNWGDASGMAIIDDTEWQDNDYTMLDEASDHRKVFLAEAIAKWIRAGRPMFDNEDSTELADLIMENFGA